LAETATHAEQPGVCPVPTTQEVEKERAPEPFPEQQQKNRRMKHPEHKERNCELLSSYRSVTSSHFMDTSEENARGSRRYLNERPNLREPPERELEFPQSCDTKVDSLR
jgi:hypothetical protein